MNNQLTNKERLLLEDLRSHEETCVTKYSEYANRAQDPQLKQLFSTYAMQEQQHLDSINQLLSGQIPSTSSQAGGQQSNSGSSTQVYTSQIQQNTQQSAGNNQQDAYLCTDVLGTEKYVSSTYNTAIFEFTNTNIRQVLNHIQKEEQQHGEGIFLYMQSKGMYNPAQ